MNSFGVYSVKYSDALQGIGRVTDVTNLMERTAAGDNSEHVETFIQSFAPGVSRSRRFYRLRHHPDTLT
jgi:hypothetical protein